LRKLLPTLDITDSEMHITIIFKREKRTFLDKSRPSSILSYNYNDHRARFIVNNNTKLECNNAHTLFLWPWFRKYFFPYKGFFFSLLLRVISHGPSQTAITTLQTLI